VTYQSIGKIASMTPEIPPMVKKARKADGESRAASLSRIEPRPQNVADPVEDLHPGGG